MFLAEFFGTFTLIVLGDGVVANVLLNKSKGQNAGWIVITAGWAIAVMAGVFVSSALGGPGSLNPAGVISGWVAPGGAANIGTDVVTILGQFAGAFVGAIVVYLLYYAHWEATSDAGLKLAVFSTGPAIRNPLWNLVTEIIGTFVLVFGILAIRGAEGDMGSLAIIPVAFLVWAIGLSLGGPTGYAINPARDLGPRIAHAILPIPGKGDSDWGYSWIPVVGPIIGASLAMIVRMAIGL